MKREYIITILAVAAIAGALWMLPSSASAQTYKKEHRSTLVIAGNGTDIIHTLTIQAPALSSSPSITLPGASLVFPAANASGVLTNDGSGNLSWTLVSAISWSLTGNAGITGGDFLGTTDANDLLLKGDNVTGITIGGAANAGNVGIGTTPTTNTLAVGGNIQMTSATNDKITTSNSELVLEQTGDTYGTTRLHIQNRNGSNGALFEQAGNAGIDLVDFGFKPGAGVQSNLRLEARTSTIRNTANDAFGEFEFMMNTLGSGGSPTYNFSTGEGASSFEVGNVGIGLRNPSQELTVYNGNVLLSNGGTADELELQGTSSGISTFQAGAQGATNINYTLPAAAPSSNGQALLSSTGGIMSWGFPVASSGASSQDIPSDPNGTASTSAEMMGLAESFTPATSGKVLIILSGDATSSSSPQGGSIQIRYGTGTAPSNGDPGTGTTAGSDLSYRIGHASQILPWSLNTILTGLTVGTTYWVDVSLSSSHSGTTVSLSNISASIVEIP